MKWLVCALILAAGPVLANGAQVATAQDSSGAGETASPEDGQGSVAQADAEAAQPVEAPGEEDAPMPDPSLETYLWQARPLVVFAPSEADPRFQQQLALIEAGLADLQERDVVILTDTDPSANGPLRQKLHPRDFQLVLIGKDGSVKLRKPFPWDTRELSRVIDKMPMRQQEMRRN